MRELYGRDFEEITPCYDNVPSVDKYGEMKAKDPHVSSSTSAGKADQEEELNMMIIYSLVGTIILIFILAWQLEIWCFAPKAIAYSEAKFGGDSEEEEEEEVIASKDVRKALQKK